MGEHANLWLQQQALQLPRSLQQHQKAIASHSGSGFDDKPGAEEERAYGAVYE